MALVTLVIGLCFFMVGVSIMPHPLLAGGSEFWSDIGIYGGAVVMAVAYFQYKNWL